MDLLWWNADLDGDNTLTYKEFATAFHCKAWTTTQQLLKRAVALKLQSEELLARQKERYKEKAEAENCAVRLLPGGRFA